MAPEPRKEGLSTRGGSNPGISFYKDVTDTTELTVSADCYLSGICDILTVTTDVDRGINKIWKCFVKFGRPIDDHSYIALAENVCSLRAKLIEIMPQCCVKRPYPITI